MVRIGKKWSILTAGLLCASALLVAVISPAAQASTSRLKTGLKAFVIPKNLGNNYFTTADSVKTGGALYALKVLRDHGTETSGTADTPASQLPAIDAAISKGAQILIVSATDPTALCSTLNSAMKRGITVVTYDSDAPSCRDLYISQASAAEIGRSEVDIMAKEVHDTGQIAVVSSSADDTNQNTWIRFMKLELKKFPKMKLVSVVYGNDDTATSTAVTQGLLSRYPKLEGIISPTTVGIAAAAAVLDVKAYRGKVHLTGLGTPDAMRKYVLDGTCPEFELWNPANLGYLAAWAAVEFYSHAITNAKGQHFIAGKLGRFSVESGHTILLGPPFVFDKGNIKKFNF